MKDYRTTSEPPKARSLQRLVRRIPVDFGAIAAETGMTRGKLCRSTWAGWVVQNTTNNPDWPDMATVTPPATEQGETLTVEDNHWCVYAPNAEVSDAHPAADVGKHENRERGERSLH